MIIYNHDKKKSSNSLLRWKLIKFITVMKIPQFKEKPLMWWKWNNLMCTVMKIYEKLIIWRKVIYIMKIHHSDKNCLLWWSIIVGIIVHQCNWISSGKCLMKTHYYDENLQIWKKLINVMKVHHCDKICSLWLRLIVGMIVDLLKIINMLKIYVLVFEDN